MLAATSPAYAEPPFSTVSGGLSQIAESDPAELSADAIRDDIRWFAAQIGALEALSARWLAERHWFQMRSQAAQEAGLAAEQEQRRRRWLYLRQTRDGSFRMEAQLDAETGVTFKTALHALMGPRASHDDRTPAERRADAAGEMAGRVLDAGEDRKSTRLNSSHSQISYAVFCLK